MKMLVLAGVLAGILLKTRVAVIMLCRVMLLSANVCDKARAVEDLEG